MIWVWVRESLRGRKKVHKGLCGPKRGGILHRRHSEARPTHKKDTRITDLAVPEAPDACLRAAGHCREKISGLAELRSTVVGQSYIQAESSRLGSTSHQEP